MILKDKVFIIAVTVSCVAYFVFLNNDIYNLNDPLTSKTILLKSNLSCSAKRSTNKKDIGEVISLIGIDTDNPRVLFSNSGGTSPLKKLFESEETLTLGLVAFATGGTDIFVLNKKTGEFARTLSGNLANIYVSASKGVCK